MINRNLLQCDGCGVRIVTRTAIGHGDRQEHSFPCPECGVDISFVLELDQKNISFRYREPTNAHWVESEDERDVRHVLSFDAERMVPRNLPDRITPFLATFWNIIDPEIYQREEGLRTAFRTMWSPQIERMATHFGRRNYGLFDKAARHGGVAPEKKTRKARLALLLHLYEQGFRMFTRNTAAESQRVSQRIALSETTASKVFAQLAHDYARSGRLGTLWQEVRSIRRGFLKEYPNLLPLVQLWYWHENKRDMTHFHLANKAFGTLRQLHVDCFETLWRLLVIAVGLEGIIQSTSPQIKTKKGSMSVWDYEQMPNGSKPGILTQYPIADLFVDVLDHKLRNGIGHHSAHYVDTDDAVVYHEAKGAKLVERRLAYSEFAQRTLTLFGKVELAAPYLSALQLTAEGARRRIRER